MRRHTTKDTVEISPKQTSHFQYFEYLLSLLGPSSRLDFQMFLRPGACANLGRQAVASALSLCWACDPSASTNRGSRYALHSQCRGVRCSSLLSLQSDQNWN